MSAAARPVFMPSADAMLDALPVAVYTTDAAGWITSYNEAAAAFWGRSPVLGEERWCGAWRLFWPDGSAMGHDETALALALHLGKPVHDREAILERPDGSRAVFRPHATPMFDDKGAVAGAVNMLVDITDSKNSEEAREHFAAIVASSDDAIISKDLNGIIRSWNKGAERIFGYSKEEAIGRSITMLIPEDRQNEEPGIIERIRRGERIEHYETIRQRKDGSLIDISLSVSPVKNGRGEVVGASKIARDISERKRAEESRELLLHEIKHRVKNTLGTVQAIASQTFRSGPREEREAFAARLRALAGAHDLLIRQDFDSVRVGELMARAMAPFRENRADRIEMGGDDIVLNANQALLLAMAAHELATNAVKYGALSNGSGMVHLHWALRQNNGRRLVLNWRESGGPTVSQPSRKGFGSTLIERALLQEQGCARVLFLAEGLNATLEMKL
jgi:PAS domain S-box-containing protein